ncbi:hypothetical protein ABZ412_15730 [Nocardia sp. NPDC005746]|uniref:hypothetical protein n=1 Tax=Nocardia sp. NPDC005746 TaxID=3157062 RepID=UPI0033C48133
MSLSRFWRRLPDRGRYQQIPGISPSSRTWMKHWMFELPMVGAGAGSALAAALIMADD